MQQKLNAHYAKLATELGHLTCQLERLQTRRAELLSEINNLHDLTPLVMKMHQDTQLEYQKTDQTFEATEVKKPGIA